EPEAVAALRAGRDDKVNRLLRLPLPQPYAPTRLEAFRDRKRTRPQPAKAAPARRVSRNPDPPLRPAFPLTAGRAGRRAGHHRSGERYRGERQPGRARELEGQRYG